MESDLKRRLNPSLFPFDLLPLEIQSRILALLPITTLVLCKAVSRAWRSLIRSPAFTDSYPPSRDPIFLLHCSDCPAMSACAYLPSTDSWIDFRFPQPISILPTTGTSLLLTELDRDQCIVNPFSPPHPVHILPPLPRLHRLYSVLALIQDNPSDYIVVAIRITKRAKCIYSQTYDSRSGRWEERGHLLLGPGSVERRNAVYLDGLLYCMSRLCRGPSRLLTFDPIGGQWSMVHLDLPVHCIGYLLFSFGGELCVVTGFLREGMMIDGIGIWGLTGIGIWELDRLTMTWKEFDFMPDKYFTEFSDRGRRSLSMVECKGMVCFFSLGTKEIVMCDLAWKTITISLSRIPDSRCRSSPSSRRSRSITVFKSGSQLPPPGTPHNHHLQIDAQLLQSIMPAARISLVNGRFSTPNTSLPPTISLPPPWHPPPQAAPSTFNAQHR